MLLLTFVHFTGNSRALLGFGGHQQHNNIQGSAFCWTLSELMQDETQRLAQTISLIHLLQQAGCVTLFIYR